MIRLQDLLTEMRWGPDADIAKLIDQNIQRIVAEIAESAPSRLGSGYYGTAYQLASGRVLKITADTSEVTTAMRRRHSVPHLMSYYDIRSIIMPNVPDWQYDLNNTRFALLMDAVTPLTPAQSSIWDAVIAWSSNSYFDLKYTTQEELERQLLPRGFTTHADVPLFRTDFEFYQQVMAQRDAIARAVKRYNIRAYEAHGQNVGIDASGRITIYDMQTAATTTRFDRSAVRVNRTVNELVGRLPKIVLEPVKFDATGIDTPGDPTM
jgi:hypothetical protein